MFTRAIALILGGAMLAGSPALAGGAHKHDHDHKKEAGHTQLDAHEHGHGALNIAIDGKTIVMELEIPAADIIGFEHAAKTDAQKAKLADGKAKLGQPLKLFPVNADAKCTLAKADIEVEGAIAGDDRGHGHSHGHKDAGGESHSEFHAKYEISCANPDKLTSIQFAFFKTFGNSKELDVSLVGDKGVKKFEASDKNATLSFGGAS